MNEDEKLELLNMSDKNNFSSQDLRKHLHLSNNSEYFDKFRYKSDQPDEIESRKDPRFETLNKFLLETPIDSPEYTESGNPLQPSQNKIDQVKQINSKNARDAKMLNDAADLIQ